MSGSKNMTSKTMARGFCASCLAPFHHARSAARPGPAKSASCSRLCFVGGDNHYVGVRLDLAGLGGHEEIGKTRLAARNRSAGKFQEGRSDNCGEQRTSGLAYTRGTREV